MFTFFIFCFVLLSTILVISNIKSNNNTINSKNTFFSKIQLLSTEFLKKNVFIIIKHATFLLLFRFLIINFLLIKEKTELVRGVSINLSLYTVFCLLIFLLFLGIVAFYTLLERKVIAAVQRREGPNVSGPFGILQPLMDGVKLILKELNPSNEASSDSFDLAPIISFTISFAS